MVYGPTQARQEGDYRPSAFGTCIPPVDPEEVHLFNRLEVQRIEGSSSETIEKFNRKMTAMWVHFEVA